MKNKNKIRVYLDYNIYNRICENIIDDSIFKSNNVKVFLSVAHAEEYYKACKNDIDKQNCKKLTDVFNEMVSLTPCGVLNPSKTRIKNINEKFNDCLERVKEYDTGDIVINNGKVLHEIQKESVKSYVKDNKKVINYSNLSCNEIWNQKEIIEELNKYPRYIDKYKQITFMQIASLYGFEQAESICNIKSDGFQLKENCYNKLKNNYSLLECVIEFLYNVLGECGYNRDKQERTAISGIHDVQHSIYATYCNYFISEDESFSKRTNAVYTYLGIETQVISAFEFQRIIKGIIKE